MNRVPAAGKAATDVGHLILVVHANGAHARPIERLLEAAGYEVISASEFDDILSLERRGQPDLVVVHDEDFDAVPVEIKNGSIPVVVVGRNAARADGLLHCPINYLVKTVADHFQARPLSR